MRRVHVRWLLLVVVLLSGGVLMHESWSFLARTAELEFNARRQGREEVNRAAAELERLVKGIQATARELADEINTGEIPQREIQRRLQALLDEKPHLTGIGAVFHPLTGLANVREVAPMYVSRDRAQGGAHTELLEVARLPIFQLDTAGNQVTNGMVWVDVSRRLIQSHLDALKLGKYGYAFLMSGDGRYLLHPREEVVAGGQTVFEIAAGEDSRDLVKLGKQVTRGLPATVELVNPAAGQDLLVFTEPIPSCGWSVGAAYLKGPLLHPTETMQRNLFRVILAGTVMVCALLLIQGCRSGVCLTDCGWRLSATISLVLMLAIGGVWWFTLRYKQFQNPGEIQLTDSSVVARFVNDYRRECRTVNRPPPVFVPTGVFVQSVEFQSAANVKLTGYLWQRWPVDRPAGLTDGVILPDAQEASMEQAYEQVVGNERVIGWNFSTVVRESFDYTTYPFDQQSIWLRMWAKDIASHVVLVPDFAAYQSMSPGFRPGIDARLVLPGWSKLSSYFSFLDFAPNSSFGLSARRSYQATPDLHFNLVIQRQFLDAFIGCLFPLLIVLVLVFGVLFMHTRSESLVEHLGYNASITIQVAAALFFVVLFAQIDLRRTLEVQQIMYMDFYYFLTYLIFLGSAVNSLAFGMEVRPWWIDYQDNLIPKLLYWPLSLSTLFVVTAWYFYP